MTTELIYACPETEDFALSEGDDGKVLYRKQLIYPGEFTDAKGDTHSVTAEDIDHWVATAQLMSENGLDVPVPLGHTENAEARRGTVVAFEAGEDDKGRYSLYGLFDFGDDDSPAKRGNNVSIYVPPSYRDGKKNEYYRPVRHVALTDYPVVPDLKGFEKAIVASLDSKPKGKPQMDDLIQLLNDELGLMIEPGSNQAMVFAKIRSAISEAKAAKPDEDADDTDDETVEEPKEVAASLLSLVSTSRSDRIGNLVKEGKITPAVGKKLTDQYTSKDSLSLSFSKDGEFAEDAGFDGVVKALEENEPVISFGEKTGPQGGGQSVSPLVADAERRANNN